MKNAILSSQENADFNEGDYYAPCFSDNDELIVLYCGKCHNPKEFYPYIPRNVHQGSEVAPEEERQYFTKDEKPVKVAVKCKCKNESKEDIRKSLRRASKLKHTCWGYKAGNEFVTNEAMEALSFDNVQSNTHIEKATGYLLSFDERRREHKGIMFLGEHGSGKTVAAACLANALMDKGVSVEFKQQFEITTLSQYNDKDELSHLQSCSVLFIDDFNPKELTAYAEELLYNIIELRIKRGLITCFTSNATRAYFSNPSPAARKRLTERIVSTCYVVEDSANNYRSSW